MSRVKAFVFPTNAAGPRAGHVRLRAGAPIIAMVSMGKPSDAVSQRLGEVGCRRMAFVFSNEAVLHARLTGELRTRSRLSFRGAKSHDRVLHLSQRRGR